MAKAPTRVPTGAPRMRGAYQRAYSEGASATTKRLLGNTKVPAPRATSYKSPSVGTAKTLGRSGRDHAKDGSGGRISFGDTGVIDFGVGNDPIRR